MIYLKTVDKFVEYWRDYFDKHIWENGEKLGIYIDFPFCRSVCEYCVFGSSNFYKCKNLIPEYERSVLDVMQRMVPILSTIKTPDDIYFGGGTPTLWTTDTLREIINTIPNYHSISVRKSEAHPYDLTPERIKFMIEEMRLNSISIGVQSFDHNANIQQKRIPVDIRKLKDVVKVFQNHGIYVGIDLVALFNGETDHDWNIFRKDMDICMDWIRPDSIAVNPNFKVRDYYESSHKFRMILQEFENKSFKYFTQNEILFSQNDQDILDFGTGAYFLMTSEYMKFIIENPVTEMNRSIKLASRNNIIAFGGGEGHHGLSRTSDLKELSSFYYFPEHRWIFNLHDTEMTED